MRNVLVRNLTKKKPHDRINVINQLFSGQCPVIRFKCSKSDKLLSEPVELLHDRHFWMSSLHLNRRGRIDSGHRTETGTGGRSENSLKHVPESGST